MSDRITTTSNLFRDDSAPLISCRQLALVEIKPQLACALNAVWHSRLPYIDWSNVVRNTAFVCYAVEYDGHLYGVAIWSSPVAQNRLKNGKNILELRRLAICHDAPKYTATRMISQMITRIRKKFPFLTTLISYQDTEVHSGTIYRASNWKLATYSDGQSWSTDKRKRNVEQSRAIKIRWEFEL